MAARKKPIRRQRIIDTVGVDPTEPTTPVVTALPVSGQPAWLVWYNTRASLNEQNTFDQAAVYIDAGNGDYVQNFAGSPLYDVLVNYRDTGGRRALQNPQKNYGTVPISVAKSGGPIESTPTGYVLHPGHYTYTAVHDSDDAFKKWLTIQAPGDVVVGMSQQSTSTFPLGVSPYYTDYEMTVTKDVEWPTEIAGEKLPGVPTWLPPNVSITDYWGQVTSYHPNWSWVPEAGKSVEELLKGVLLVGGIVGAAWLITELKPRRLREE